MPDLFNRYIGGLRPGYNAEKHRKKEAEKVNWTNYDQDSFLQRSVIHVYKEELLLLEAFRLYVWQTKQDNDVPKRDRRVKPSKTGHDDFWVQLRQYDGTEGLSPEFATWDYIDVGRADHMYSRFICRIVYRAIWDAECPENYEPEILVGPRAYNANWSLHGKFSWPEYAKPVGNRAGFGKVWLNEVRDAYEAFYDRVGPIKGLKDCAKLEVKIRNNDDQYDDGDPEKPYFHRKPDRPLVDMKEFRKHPAQYRELFHCEDCWNPYGFEAVGWLKKILH